ncbi:MULTISPECIES: dicarboxylate/amino acid:cation symporter [Acetobacter]|jgi:Na+/H+-dicarboxylate symporter|uniref:Na+/H+-dicarboxylate symporter n=1 Tax=Acetobacter lovaniensis TaxID=104100 RepID=A0A841QIQ5_9PROT|nr:dicarboxylate/amino acid:cation symporter [Acetobacter lovaniensis]MBB6458328.1 Na+/H+-dicarboxylate symporter [Acetobacter lovaniensis]MCI1698913.1 dicarboxylate/amino acid:cation symporter [Acetobacter lovaniensis]MCI1795208.1 dicarboxylate/amino acid:cation symporter [Acetobacter lovaniensis]MCP1240940.1 dicarboxylate/amino acid:cation symporter [Acetobacter lovaniensis]NHN82559.1 cation:dicarboxylase symporter family transporter [Acetobacter lovaniensis]
MAAATQFGNTRRRTYAILVALGLGIVCGLSIHVWAPAYIGAAEQASTLLTGLFLRLIRMVIAPLVFATLVSGIGKLGDDTLVLRVGGKVILWFLAMSFISLTIGLLAANILRPGAGFTAPLPADIGSLRHAFQPVDFVLHIVPTSILDAMSRNDILQIVVFSVLFGVSLPAAGKAGKTMLSWSEELAHIMLRMTDMVMVLAPIAVFGSIMGSLAHSGPEMMMHFGRFLLQFYGTIMTLWVVLTFITFCVIGPRVKELIQELVQPVILGFATASSESVYPLLLERLENFGVPSRIAGFVLPLGYSFNLDGSILFQSFGAIFIAQAYGIHLPWTQQALMVLVMMLSSKGIAGVPRASLVTLVAVLPQFGLPEAGIALILGIDHFLDMARTATNVLGNGYAAAVSAKWEGVLSEGPTEDVI